MSIVKEALIEEIKELTTKSKHYSSELENAKTKVKKDLMKKRLKANNNKVADLLIALDKINKEENNGESSSKRGTET